jgi:hypothetical protein
MIFCKPVIGKISVTHFADLDEVETSLQTMVSLSSTARS